MNSNQTHTHILGQHFYINWKNDNEGYDQHGIKWINKSNPECTNKQVVNICIDNYNTIMAINKN